MTEIKLNAAWLLVKDLSESWINETIVRRHHVVSAQDVATRLDTLEAENAQLREALAHVAVLGYGKCTIGKPLAEMVRAALSTKGEV